MNYLSFKEFVDEYELKDEATSNVEINSLMNKISQLEYTKEIMILPRIVA